MQGAIAVRRPTLSMLPGPTFVPESVMKAMLDSNIYHRSEEFHKLFQEIREDLRHLFGTKGEVFVLTSSGTGGLEAVVSNILKPGEKALSVVNGYFSRELSAVIEACGGKSEILRVDLRRGISSEQVERYLKKTERVKFVALTQVETSTGSRAPLREIAEICRRHGALLIVDAESAVAGEELPFDDWKIGACVAGTQKCICSPPGLSLVCLGEDAWDIVEKNKGTGYYFDLLRYSAYSGKNETPFTPAIPLFFALRESLKLIRREGLEARISRHRDCASLLREGLMEMNLEPFVPLEHCSNVVTAVELSGRGIHASQLVKRMASSFGINIAAGMGEYKERMVRIGTMGTVVPEDVHATLDALKKCVS